MNFFCWVFLFRLGFLIDFLSHAAIVGFMGGAAITIALQQLKGLLGIKSKKFTKKSDLVSVMRSVFTSAHHGVRKHTLSRKKNEKPNKQSLNLYFIFLFGVKQWNYQTILIGVSFLAFLLLAKYIVSIISI